jgi:hypothetical protein
MKLTAFTNSINAQEFALLANTYRLEAELLKLPQAAIVTRHTFRPGIYERTIIIPPWTTLTGAAHRTAYTVRLERGTIVVNTDDGVVQLVAPCEFRAPAGVKRVGHVLDEEVVWTDIYGNPDDCQDMEVLVDRLYGMKNCDMGDNRAPGRALPQPQYGRLSALVAAVPAQIQRDRSDYLRFLSQIGATDAQVLSIAQNEGDLIPMPAGVDVEVRESPINGRGLFVLRDFGAGEFIAPGRINGMRTPAGRFINHSSAPNAATAKTESGDLGAVAVRGILAGEEILIDYRNSMRVNFGIALEGEKTCQVG